MYYLTHMTCCRSLVLCIECLGILWFIWRIGQSWVPPQNKWINLTCWSCHLKTSAYLREEFLHYVPTQFIYTFHQYTWFIAYWESNENGPLLVLVLIHVIWCVAATFIWPLSLSLLDIAAHVNASIHFATLCLCLVAAFFYSETVLSSSWGA